MSKRSISEPILYVITLLLVLATCFIFFMPDIVGDESCGKFVNIMLFAFIMVGLTGFILSNRRILFLNFLCAAILALYQKSTTIEVLHMPVKNADESINLVEVNLADMDDMMSVRKILKDTTINVLVFQQCDPDRNYLLDTIIQRDFANHAKLIQLQPNGTSIYCKMPLLSVDTLMVGSYPVLKISVLVHEDTISILSAYIPGNNIDQKQNRIDQSYSELANLVAKSNRRMIIIGQFNQTYWSQNIVHLKNTLNLNNSRRIIYPIISMMPHDHIFYTSDLQCYAFSEVLSDSRTRIGSKAYFVVDKFLNDKKK